MFGPPFVREMPKVKNLVAGGTNVQIDCPYSGYPIETISWYKDGKCDDNQLIIFDNIII